MAEVPKVTREQAAERGEITLPPPPCGADQPIRNHAEPEVDEQAYVELEWPMARQGQRGRKEEVDHVAEDDGEEGLEEI